MKKFQILVLGLILITAFSCKQIKKDAEKASEEIEETVDQTVEKMEPKVLTLKMEPKSDSNVMGEVTFTEDNGEVIMKVLKLLFDIFCGS